MLALLDLDTDMARGQEQSYDIYAAEQAVEEAEDLDRDTRRPRRADPRREYQLESAEESFQQNFTKLFRAVSENNRLLSVAREALDYQNEVTETQKLKYDLGTISRMPTSRRRSTRPWQSPMLSWHRLTCSRPTCSISGPARA